MIVRPTFVLPAAPSTRILTSWAAMNEFLVHLETPEARRSTRTLSDLERRARSGSTPAAGRRAAGRVANMSSIWTVCYTQPSRYNWMLQYYLRAEGLALSWVGTGRLIFSLNYIEADFEAVAERFVAAAKAMQRDGWWWSHPAITNKSIRRAIFKEMIAPPIVCLASRRSTKRRRSAINDPGSGRCGVRGSVFGLLAQSVTLRDPDRSIRRAKRQAGHGGRV